MRLYRRLKDLLALMATLTVALALSACGGGDSSTTTISGAGLNSLGFSPAVSLGTFTQVENNMQVMVMDPAIPDPFNPNATKAEANILFATVRVCNPTNPTNCLTIDKVLVDTGSVGLRLFATQLAALQLPAVGVSGTDSLRECYLFVTGSLWGKVALADITMGREVAFSVPIQLIEDDTAAIQPSADCISKSRESLTSAEIANGQTGIMKYPFNLGANGILGVGSVTPDCGLSCFTVNTTVDPLYPNNPPFNQYHSCPANAVTVSDCPAAQVPENFQVQNPVSRITQLVDGSPSNDNNGVILTMPAVTGLGAQSATGELIFGIGTRTNNQLPALVTPVQLGTRWLTNPDYYLSVKTVYNNQTYTSYLDTGTNGLFFVDASFANVICTSGSWYCPTTTRNATATIADGDGTGQTGTTVNFSIGSADAMFSTRNAAFGNLGGTFPGNSNSGPPTFAWGMPFFYGKKTYLSIWDPTGPSCPASQATPTCPLYVWTVQ